MKNSKKLLALLLSVIMVLGVCAVGITVSADDEGGFTWNADENRYEISDYAGLKAFAESVNGGNSYEGKTVALTDDIIADDNLWVAIGNSETFNGVFDGCGHTVTGLSNAGFESSPQFIGLFGIIDRTGCKVMNVGVVNAEFKASSFAGGVVGDNINGTVKNCYNSGSGNLSGKNVGGVVGSNAYGTVENCYNSGSCDIKGGEDSNVGGVVGCNDFGTVENCYNSGSGNITGGDDAGGVVGYNSGFEDSPAVVKNCYYYGSGEISDSHYGSGGVVGFNPLDSTVVNSFYCSDLNNIGTCIGNGYGTTSNVSGLSKDEFKNQSNFGGYDFENVWYMGAERPMLLWDRIAGSGTADDPYVIKNYNQLKEFASSVNGGNSYEGKTIVLTDDITADDNLWVAIGNNSTRFKGVFDGDNHTVTGLSNAGFESAPQFIGLFGLISGTGCKVMNTGVINADFRASDYAGGVVGFNSYGTVSNCYNSGSGNITGGQYSSAGGVVGCNGYGTIENCYNSGSGNISGDSRAGGVVGYNNRGTVSDCYNSGSGIISGDSDAGGVVGYNNGSEDSPAVVKNCYYYGSGEISGNRKGGVIGYNPNGGTVVNSFYCSDLNNIGTCIGVGNGTSSNVSRLTKEEFKNPAKFAGDENYPGFFTKSGDEYVSDVWVMGGSRPLLKWAVESGAVSLYETGDIIEYGTYPQSRVDETEALRAAAEAATWKSYNYYSGTGKMFDGNLVPGDWMKFADFFLDGEKYRAVYFTDYRPKYTAYQCGADHSEVDNNGYEVSTEENKKLYYFAYEPVKWRVLNPDEGLVMSETILDSQAYNNYIIKIGDNYYGDEGAENHSVYASDYANSSIRQWLNDDFYNTAFTDAQKENIKTTELDNRGYYSLTGDTEHTGLDSASTNDKVFLLSYTEALNGDYGFSTSEDDADSSRQAQGSDYAKCQGLYANSDNSSWLLRSPGSSFFTACYVNTAGYVNNFYTIGNTNIGVRPALKLQNLKSDTEVAAIAVDIPEGVTDERYIGSEITGVQAGEGYTLSGTVKATDAGSYTATAILEDGFVWSDGTYENKEISWKIKPRLIWHIDEVSLDEDSFVYDGEEKKPTIGFYKDTGLDKELVENVDYEITAVTWKNNVNVNNPDETDQEKIPTAVIEITGKGNYCDVQTHYLWFDINKADPEVTAPEAVKDLKADGTAKELVTAGQTTGGTLEYSLDGENYSADIPTAADEGTYTVYYRVTGDGNYNDAAAQTVSAAIGENIHTVTYIVDGEEFSKMEVNFGESVPQPRKPQKDGYTFAWVDEIPETMPAEDITINGKYTAIEYTATFTADGKTVDTVKFTVKTEKLDEPAVPEKEGFTSEWSKYTLAASDIEITAVYTPVEYTATFIADGKTVAEVPFTVETESITEPAVPEKEGYTGEWSKYTLGASDIEINAVYTEIPAEPATPDEPATETEPENDNLCPLDGTDHGTTFMGKIIKFFHSILWWMFRIVGINLNIRITWA